MKKSRAQLDREIAEALSKKKPSGKSRIAHATKKDYDWDSFIDGAALGFWSSPYVSEVLNLYEDAQEKRRAGNTRAADALEAAYRALKPSPGGTWDIPETPPAAYVVAKKFTKAVKEKLTEDELDDISSSFSARDAGYYGAMQSQGEGVGWHDEGVRTDPPTGFDWDPKIQNALYTVIRRGAREAGVKLPR
jgi:hypothetical protein